MPEHEMSVVEVSISKMSSDKMCAHETLVNVMSIVEVSIVKMSLDEMS
jgi:hypothetical protein